MAKYQEEKPFKNPAYITVLKVFIITLHLNNILKFTKYFHNFSYFFSLLIQLWKVGWVDITVIPYNWIKKKNHEKVTEVTHSRSQMWYEAELRCDF